MRVISGSAKGRRLKMVTGDGTRPVMDRVKEALFNIIGQDIVGSVFLDLFAGTGSVGIEALSRGAEKAVFIEIDRKACQVIQENLEMTRLMNRAVLKRADAFQVLKQPPAEPYDFIYIAPPQYKGMWIDALKQIDAQLEWSPPGTTVIVQIDPEEEQTFELKRLEQFDQRRYGSTLLMFFTAQDDAVHLDEDRSESA
ncbi:MAG: 16S rRNA (guanine(966)-N(2))-methyltransferase RsmD [Anaerolineae bacterium]|nr:16S rRNA (guanine(966)-N(2))-methyltransferase RsmD [Anaerolineae bacterium]